VTASAADLRVVLASKLRAQAAAWSSSWLFAATAATAAVVDGAAVTGRPPGRRGSVSACPQFLEYRVDYSSWLIAPTSEPDRSRVPAVTPCYARWAGGVRAGRQLVRVGPVRSEPPRSRVNPLVTLRVFGRDGGGGRAKVSLARARASPSPSIPCKREAVQHDVRGDLRYPGGRRRRRASGVSGVVGAQDAAAACEGAQRSRHASTRRRPSW
jgi:hypothetical protein